MSNEDAKRAVSGLTRAKMGILLSDAVADLQQEDLQKGKEVYAPKNTKELIEYLSRNAPSCNREKGSE